MAGIKRIPEREKRRKEGVNVKEIKRKDIRIKKEAKDENFEGLSEETINLLKHTDKLLEEVKENLEKFRRGEI